MPVSRRFQIAPPIARLIQKSFVPARVTEGHFPPHSERQSHVRLDNRQASLILTTFGANSELAEETTSLTSVHAEALLTVCPGTVVIERSAVPLTSMHAFVDRFVAPGPLDLVSVEFATSTEAAGFQPPMWFGMEVSADDQFLDRGLRCLVCRRSEKPRLLTLPWKLFSTLWMVHPLPRRRLSPYTIVLTLQRRSYTRCRQSARRARSAPESYWA